MPSVWARETNAFQSSSREADAALLFGNGSAPPLGGSARQPSVGRGKPGLSRARPRARGPWNTAGSAASEDMPRKPLAGKAWWRIGHWGVRFLPRAVELAAMVPGTTGKRSAQAEGRRREDGSPKGQDPACFWPGLGSRQPPPGGGTHRTAPYWVRPAGCSASSMRFGVMEDAASGTNISMRVVVGGCSCK
ncbi:hypothetical protein CBL13_05735 [Pseudomonas putida]|nr:hypothetical protein CBL13_05735 [Pseudomonas putida]